MREVRVRGAAGAAHDGARPLVLAQEAVQVRQVHGVDVPLVPLEVVARRQRLGREHRLLRRREELVRGEQRRLARPEVREDEPSRLGARVRRMPDLLLERAALRLAGLVDARPAHVVEPSVVEAAQPAVLDAPVAEIGGAVGAVQPQQAELALVRAEERQLLAEDAERERGAAGRELLGERDGMPVAAEHLAAGRAGAGQGQEVVVLAGEHAAPPSAHVVRSASLAAAT